MGRNIVSPGRAYPDFGSFQKYSTLRTIHTPIDQFPFLQRVSEPCVGDARSTSQDTGEIDLGRQSEGLRQKSPVGDSQSSLMVYSLRGIILGLGFEDSHLTINFFINLP